MINMVKLPTNKSSLFLRVAKGHFATSHSHINYYIDVTTQKARLSEAKAVAKELVAAYQHSTIVDTVLCLDGTQVIGTCLANELTKDGFANMTAHQTEHLIILTARMEYPADRSQQKVLEHFLHIIAFLCTEKMMQAGAYSRLSIPCQTVQYIPNRMVAVFVCHNGERSQQFLLTGQAIILLKVEKKIFYINIGQRTGSSVPTQIPDNINLFCQKIQANGITQKRITTKYCFKILNGVGWFSFFRCRKDFPYTCNIRCITLGI